MTERPTPGGSPVLALVLLLVVDIGIGLWLKLHKPEYLPLFVVVNAPTIGVTGFFWPLLPKEAKDRIGAGLASVLGSPRTVRAMLLIGGVLFVTSLSFGSVRVELLDTGTATTIHVVRGSQSAPDSGAVAKAVSFRLNRLSTPHSEVLAVPPSGQRIWVYSPTHVLFRDARVVPWLPVKLQYPADFAPMASVAVLPGWEIMSRVLRGNLELSVRENESGPVLASKVLDTNATVIGFLRPARITPDDSTKWHLRLSATGDAADSENLQLMLRRWLKMSWVQSGRPLRQGDTVAWEVRSVKDTSLRLAEGRLVLDASLADLYLKF